MWVDVLKSPTTLSREQFTRPLTPTVRSEVRKTPVSHLPSSLHVSHHHSTEDQAREGGQRYHFSREFRTYDNLPRRQKIWEKVTGSTLPQGQAGFPQGQAGFPGPLPPRLHIPAARAVGQAPPHFPFLPTLFPPFPPE